MYRNRKGATFVFISDPDGLVRQWKLIATPTGKVRAEPVRDLKFDTQTEGCVADDETGALYVAEEDVALWKLGAEPGAGAARKAVARVADNPALKDDLEGVGLYAQGAARAIWWSPARATTATPCSGARATTPMSAASR
jgi:3-phytase